MFLLLHLLLLLLLLWPIPMGLLMILLRLLLLLGWAGLVMALLPGQSLSELIRALVQGVRRHPASALAVLLSLEASVWLHLLLDGDPWPSEWRRQRRR